MLKHLHDLLWLALVVLLFPVAILAIGLPVALLVRLVTEILQRW